MTLLLSSLRYCTGYNYENYAFETAHVYGPKDGSYFSSDLIECTTNYTASCVGNASSIFMDTNVPAAHYGCCEQSWLGDGVRSVLLRLSLCSLNSEPDIILMKITVHRLLRRYVQNERGWVRWRRWLRWSLYWQLCGCLKIMGLGVRRTEQGQYHHFLWWLVGGGGG